MDLAHRTALLICLTVGKRLQILGERGGVYVQKWHLRYKASNISETKQSRVNIYRVSIETRVQPTD